MSVSQCLLRLTDVIVCYNVLVQFVIMLMYVDGSHSSISGEKYCPYTLKSGAIIDLSPLRHVFTDQKEKFKDRPVTDQSSSEKFLYSYQPCDGFTEGTCKDAAVCQKSGAQNYYLAGSQSDWVFLGKPSANHTDPGTLVIAYNGDESRISYVHLVCTKSLELKFEVHGEVKSKQYNFTLHTQHACPKESSAPGHGLSTGSILLIVVFVMLLVYLIGGILIKYFGLGARGVELVPNLEFWTELPRLVKDGIVFCINGCKTDRTYDQI